MLLGCIATINIAHSPFPICILTCTTFCFITLVPHPPPTIHVSLHPTHASHNKLNLLIVIHRLFFVFLACFMILFILHYIHVLCLSNVVPLCLIVGVSSPRNFCGHITMGTSSIPCIITQLYSKYCPTWTFGDHTTTIVMLTLTAIVISFLG